MQVTISSLFKEMSSHSCPHCGCIQPKVKRAGKHTFMAMPLSAQQQKKNEANGIYLKCDPTSKLIEVQEMYCCPKCGPTLHRKGVGKFRHTSRLWPYGKGLSVQLSKKTGRAPEALKPSEAKRLGGSSICMAGLVSGKVRWLKGTGLASCRVVSAVQARASILQGQHAAALRRRGRRD